MLRGVKHAHIVVLHDVFPDSSGESLSLVFELLASDLERVCTARARASRRPRPRAMFFSCSTLWRSSARADLSQGYQARQSCWIGEAS